jgi:nitrite reductase/ring-hydroxylating ferredoxin subunit
MAVYAAYGLLIAHVSLGALQAGTNTALATALGAGVALVITLHLLAGRQEVRTDSVISPGGADGFFEACDVTSIPEKRGRVISVGNERVAVFRYDGKIAAISNVCRHQNGPLGEGRIIDGCVTCPWHGYQYSPESGASPAPFTEKVATYQPRVVAGKVLIDPRPYAPGTKLEPSAISNSQEVAPR